MYASFEDAKESINVTDKESFYRYFSCSYPSLVHHILVCQDLVCQYSRAVYADFAYPRALASICPPTGRTGAANSGRYFVILWRSKDFMTRHCRKVIECFKMSSVFDYLRSQD